MAAISTYIGQFFSGGIEPSTPHLILILAAVIGGALVGIGIIWEAWRDGHLWKLPTGCVFLGVIVEAAATIFLFEFDEGISRHQQSVIESQNVKIIALEQIDIPRRLIGPSARGSPTASGVFNLSSLWSELSKYPDTAAVIQVVPDFEAERLMMDVARALVSSRWKPRITDVKETGIVPFFVPEGVQVWTGPNHDEAWSAAEALSAVLAAEGIRAESHDAAIHRYDSTSVASFPDNDIRKSPPTGMVVILIGIRPAFMELWKAQSDEYRAAHPDEK